MEFPTPGLKDRYLGRMRRLHLLPPLQLALPAWIGCQPADRQRVVSHHRPRASAPGVTDEPFGLRRAASRTPPQEGSHARRATGPASDHGWKLRICR